MKSFVVMTYYQLMHAIAVALTLDEKPKLYFHMNYYNQGDTFLDKIREAGVFDQVTGITYRGDMADFLVELRKTEGASLEEIDAIGTSLFEEFLEPYYGERFEGADFEDDIFVYNDFQWHFYYISKHFKRIVGVEDGYMSLLQQTRVHEFKGDHQLVIPFIERGYFPAPLYRSEKVATVISSCYFEELDEVYKKKLKVIDFKDIVKPNKERFGAVLRTIFDIGDLDIGEGSVLMLGQPLDRTKDATPVTDFLMNRKFMEEEVKKGYHVYYKPHPAERKDSRMYVDENITVLPKSFPVELLNFLGCHFDKAMTFSSTGLDILTCASEYEMKLPSRNASREEIRNYIQELTKGEYMVIHMYVKIRELTNEALLNLYSCHFVSERIRTQLYALVDASQVDAAQDFLSTSNYIDTLRRMAKRQAKKDQTVDEDALSKEAERVSQAKVTILPCGDFDDWAIYREYLLKDTSYDYLMLLEENNYAFNLMRSIETQCNTSFPPGMVFKNHTYITDRKRNKREYPLFRGYHRHTISGQFCNRLWHRSVIRHAGESVHNEMDFSTVVCQYLGVARKRSDDLYLPAASIAGAEGGLDYFLNYARRIASDQNMDDEEKERMAVVLVGEFFDWQYVCIRHAEDRDDEDALQILAEMGICGDRAALVIANLYHCNLWDQDACYRCWASKRKQKLAIDEHLITVKKPTPKKAIPEKQPESTVARLKRRIRKALQ